MPRAQRPTFPSCTSKSSARKWRVAAVLAWIGCLFSVPAFAQSVPENQGFRLDHFVPAPSLEDGLALQLPSTLGHLRWSAQLLLDYAFEPLTSPGFGPNDPDRLAISKQRLNAHALVALGLGSRAELFVRMPVTVYQSSDGAIDGGLRFDAPNVAGMGDLNLGGSVRLIGEADDLFSLGLDASLWLPTGSQAALSGDGGIGVRGGVSAAFTTKAVVLALETGANYRPQREYGAATMGSQWYYRAGLHIPVAEAWRILLELDGATRIVDKQLFQQDANGLEGLLGARYGSPGGLYATAGVGMGLVSFAGVPAVRGLLGLGWASSREARPGKPTPEAAVEPVEPAPAPENPDKDGDGLLNEVDRCPSDPEDLDGFEDDDGCPDEDDDRDGVRDADDLCPGEQEDYDGDRDEDGCPDEEIAASEPDEDRAVPEPAAPVPEVEPEPEPTRAAVPVGTGPDERPPNVHFEHNTMKFEPSTRRDLWSVLRWFEKHPGDYRVRLVGHSSEEGEDWRNDQLARGRALVVATWLESMREWLAQRKVTLRITSEGHGSQEPLGNVRDDDARAASRRVEVFIQAR